MINIVQKHFDFIQRFVGCRPVGSVSNLNLGNYIKKVLEEAGFVLDIQPFQCPAWVGEVLDLSINGESFEGIINPFSPPCDVKGSVIALQTIKQLKMADLAKKIVLLSGELTSEVLSAKNPFYYPDSVAEIKDLLVRKEPLCVITVPNSRYNLTPMVEDWEFPIPSISVSASTAIKLMSRTSEEAKITFYSSVTHSHAENIVAHRWKLGTNKKVVICAHFDTKYYTPGAMDNASGIISLLSLAELFRGQEHPFDLELIAFNGEEYTGLGEINYIERYQKTFNDIILVIDLF